VDGRPQGTLTQPPYTSSIKLDTGSHSLKVTARDLAGNEGADAISISVLPPLQFGELCDSNEACASGMCASQGDRIFCTESCDLASASGCPEGAECLSAGDRHVCGAPPAGLDDTAPSGGSGCVVGAPAGDGAPVALLLLAGLLVTLRRPRR